MRLLIGLAVLIPAIVLAGEPTPRSIVLGYECKQINLAKTGFECKLHGYGLALHWKEKASAMSPERREYALYEFNKIIFRYFDLGGRSFEITADFWPKNGMRSCSALPSRTGYTCSDCKWKNEKGGGASCEIIQ